MCKVECIISDCRSEKLVDSWKGVDYGFLCCCVVGKCDKSGRKVRKVERNCGEKLWREMWRECGEKCGEKILERKVSLVSVV